MLQMRSSARSPLRPVPQRFPAKDAICNACNKKGHYSKVCKSSKRDHRVREDSKEDDLSILEKIWEDIYVFKGLKEPLLGQLAIEKLNLVARINEIQSQSYEERIKAKYPQLFHGLGELEGEYEIKLKPDAQPFAIMTPRRIPLQ